MTVEFAIKTSTDCLIGSELLPSHFGQILATLSGITHGMTAGNAHGSGCHGGTQARRSELLLLAEKASLLADNKALEQWMT